MPFHTTATTTTTTTTTTSSSSQKRTSSTVAVAPIQFQKKQKMSLTQTYFLAHTARAKLSREAKRGDHNLRRLVGHANLLDGLMIDLIESEKSQEALFNASVKSQSSHIEWATTLPSSHQPTIIEDFEEAEEEDSDSDLEDEEESSIQPITRQPIITTTELSQDDDDADADDNDQAIDDEEDDYEHLALTRSPSHSSPPELLLESDDDSDEESQPPSPPAPNMPMSFPPVSEGQNKVTESIPNDFYEEGFYVPQRSQLVVY